MRLNGKVAIVTGGASGIGLATVERMAREQAKVLLADYARTGLEVAAELKGKGYAVEFFHVDVSSEEQVSAMVAKAVELWGRLDIMVANAGIGSLGKADELALESWNQVLGVNLTGVFLCAKHAIPAMRKHGGGSIINTASILGHVGFPGATAYAAAKAGVVNLTHNLAIDYAKENIRVNAVCPGFIATPMVQGALTEEQAKGIAAMHPMGRLGRAEEVANAILFLASDEASFVTGSSLFVDGGYTAQ
ncbi:MAG TPA: SDR family NAD(P)-dependent oxidoreductase [Symbiobacteriaceae bacterium]|nr:SDR family NAD(P)-dependent oxidoreductase [Symbiobacteriaceae bacterium]